MVLPNGKGHVCFTYWSNSPEVPIDKPSLPEKAESYWIFNDMFPGLLMENYQFLSGKVLLSSKLWVFAFWHQSKNVSKSTNRSQSLRHLAWNKILDDSLTYLRYNLCFVNFFNSPSSNEKKKNVLCFFWWSLDSQLLNSYYHLLKNENTFISF